MIKDNGNPTFKKIRTDRGKDQRFEISEMNRLDQTISKSLLGEINNQPIFEKSQEQSVEPK